MLSSNHPHNGLIRRVERHAREIMIADYHRLLQTLKTANASSVGQPDRTAAAASRLQSRMDASRRRVQRRGQSVPSLNFPPELPICAKRQDIVDAIRKNQVVIVTGETGSGKTTQIPKMCLEAGLGLRGVIGLTQPRRIAAVSIAARIASELGQDCGQAVAYKIRFEEKTSAEPLIRVMTDGILLTETVGDRNLLAYDAIIVDEAHERSLNIDFLLGYLRNLLARRKDLKLIITSATIDTDKFARAFDGAPVIEVSGRMYPVDVRYRPLDPVAEEKGETTYVDEAVACAEDLQRRGCFEDILMFLPTEQDIREACERIGKRCSGLVLPLFARLSSEQQKLVFHSADRQKIIVATNIAETSLTIPGIKYVIDSGLARVLEYNPRSQTTGLPVKPVSQSSAEQRKGRCGRVQNGICYRLYSAEDLASRPVYSTPEILRSNLAGVVLRMLSLNLGMIDDFPFIDRPQPKSLRDAVDTLRDLGAIRRDQNEGEAGQYRLTPIGRTMAQFPLDPRVSRMIIEAQKNGCVREIAVIAAALSIQDPRERPYDKIDQAAAAHAQFAHPESDFLAYLQIWNRYSDYFEQMQPQGQRRKFCRDHFLSYRRMEEWRDVYSQILDILGGKAGAISRRKPVRAEIDQEVSDKIHRSILSGYLSNIAQKKEKNFYTAAKSREVMLYPGSGLFNRGGPWIVAAEISLTSRVFARNAANIQSEWLEELGGEHCRCQHWAAHWEKSRGQVVALEKVVLFGLTIVEQRSVAYERINPEEAWRIFIREALVTGETGRKLPFLEHNLSLREKVKTMEDKLRKRGIAADEETIAGLYEQRLPLLSDIRSLQKLIKDRGSDAFLRFREEDLIAAGPDLDELNRYPDQIRMGNAVLPCRYKFEPGRAGDGVTVRMPLGLIAGASPVNIEKHLPSLREEKALHWLKSLPKNIRRNLPPLIEVAGRFNRQTAGEDQALPLALSRFLFDEYHLTVPAGFWAPEKLPPHLQIRYSVIDDRGSEIRSSRDIGELQRELTEEIRRTSMEDCRRQWEKENLTSWDFGDLPENVEIAGKHGVTGLAYPALQDQGGAVRLRIFADPREAAAVHAAGVAALYAIHFEDRIKQLKKNISLGGELKEQASLLGSPRQVERSVLERVKRDLFRRSWRSPKEFMKHADEVRPKILSYGQEVVAAIAPVLRSFAETHDGLQKLIFKNRPHPPLAEFLQATLAEAHVLVPEDFILHCDFDRLRHLPRYLKALFLRAERGSLNLASTESKLRQAATYAVKLQEIRGAMDTDASEEKRNKTDELRWMIEEYKVSLFAQELKTPYPVSPKRLNQLIQEIGNML
ncbi:MAG: ATP-dependent RNA helicase HrpA [Smithellaceae bacterium]|jgi:ATP-dependent helicase HrpA|nr:ATP-dependent RNA helicase HrpA [Smithellaceae bacterium]